MKRLIDTHLLRWKAEKNHKPLIIRGARQVGKTFAIRKLGNSFSNLVEINFELTPDAAKIFEKDLIPKRILRELSLISGEKIEAGKTLLFFDEIQEAPKAIQALRYFYEHTPDLHVISAGSLLDFALEKTGIPVGRVSSLYLFPLSFVEFLAAAGHPMLIEAILEQAPGHPMPEPIHNKLLGLTGEYFAIGGMPEVVFYWTQDHSYQESFQIQHDLVETYRQDFQKYAKKHQVKYLEQLFRQIPHLIGKQFKYSLIHGEYRKRDLSPCLDLLAKANIIHQIHHSAGHGLPLGAETNLNYFKTIYLDIALCQATLGFDLSSWFLDPATEFINRGEVAEAFIGQELLCYSQIKTHSELYFWRRASRGSSAEIDYLYAHQGKIIPIEVKSAKGSSLRSMHTFLEKHPTTPYGIRFSSHNYSKLGAIDSRPLYAAASLAHQDQINSIKALYTN